MPPLSEAQASLRTPKLRVPTDLVSGSPVSVTETLYYNGLGQLATREWTQSGMDFRDLYTYDANGNLRTKQEQKKNGSWSPQTSWTYSWDVRDRLIQVKEETGDFGGTHAKTVDYEYCASCGGALKYRIEYDSSLNIVSWLRYEYEGLNLLRIDEMYDGPDEGSDLNQGDPFRPLNVYTHGTGSISQIVRNQTYYNGSPSTLIYYFYDALGNVITTHYGTGYTNWEMDAFGNRIDGSPGWAPITSNGPKEHLTGKMYDEDTGLYYFHARWYDPEVGRFVARDSLKPSAYHLCLNRPSSIIDAEGQAPIDPSASGNIYILVGNTGSKAKGGRFRVGQFCDCLLAGKLRLFAKMARERLATCLQGHYPSANMIVKDGASEADLVGAFMDPHAIGIVFIGHGWDGFLEAAKGDGVFADDPRISVDLQFIILLSCRSAQPIGASKGSPGKTFCGVTGATYCKDYEGKIPDFFLQREATEACIDLYWLTKAAEDEEGEDD